MQRPIRIKILDQEYLLRSEMDEARVQEIVAYVNGKLEEIRREAGQGSDTKIALLAAFEVACDYFQLMRERDLLLQEVQRRAQNLNLQIEKVFHHSGGPGGSSKEQGVLSWG